MMLLAEGERRRGQLLFTSKEAHQFVRQQARTFEHTAFLFHSPRVVPGEKKNQVNEIDAAPSG